MRATALKEILGMMTENEKESGNRNEQENLKILEKLKQNLVK